MSGRFTTTVILAHGGVPVVFAPGDAVPDWAEAYVGDHAAEFDEPPYPDGDPTKQWTKPQLLAYATAHEIEVVSGATNADILTVIEAHAEAIREADKARDATQATAAGGDTTAGDEATAEDKADKAK